MKKTEIQNIKKIVASGDFTINAHSYGTYGAGYITNFTLILNNKEHEKLFNRKVYYICFSSGSWFKVKKEGVIYNNHYHAKYKKYDEKIEAVIYGDCKVLSERLTA